MLANLLVDKTWELFATVLSVVIIPFLIQWLKAHAEAARAEGMAAQARTGSEVESNRAMLVDRLKQFMWDVASNFAEKRFPQLAQDVLASRLTTPEQVKHELHTWGTQLKDEAVEHFLQQDIDVIGEFGEDYLNQLVETTANAVSPFPGRDTAKTILQAKIAPMLVEHGIEYVRDWLRAQVPATESVRLDLKQPLPVQQQPSKDQAPIPVAVVHSPVAAEPIQAVPAIEFSVPR